MNVISADVVYPGSRRGTANGIVIIDDSGIIHDCIEKEQFISNGGNMDDVVIYKGALCPGFINAHCHLELSFLKGLISKGTGLSSFIKQLLGLRFRFPSDVMQQSFATAESEMLRNGIVAVGDISNNDSTLYIKRKGNIFYHTFVEVSGLDPFEAGRIAENALKLSELFSAPGSSSISPHSPYSVSPKLFSVIKELCYADDYPVTIHMQESIEEFAFVDSHTGKLADMFNELSFDYSKLQPYGSRPLRAVLPQLPACSRLLLVHNTLTTGEDIAWAQQMHKNIYWILCPRANLYIEETLPAVPAFIHSGAVIALGTDSLASNDTLSIADEINAIRQRYPEISLDTIIPWATYNGARALGIEKNFGSFDKGKKPGILHITAAKDSEDIRAERIF